MTDEKNIAERFMALDPKVRGGCLRTFGCWFGRPMDNRHRSVSASFDGVVLRILFDDDETLEVWNPSELVVGEKVKIPKASRVKWSWYFYGEPKTPENLKYYDYRVEDGGVTSDTNSAWPARPSIDEPAVELA